MKNFRNALYLMMVFVMVVSIFAGCISVKDDETETKTEDTTHEGGATEESTANEEKAKLYGETGRLPITEEKVTLTYLRGVDKIRELEDSWLLKKIEEETNIDIEVQQVLANDQNTKVNLMIASKKLPDILPLSKTTAEKYGGMGAFQAVNQHLDILPAMKKIWDEEEFVRKNCTLADGNLYIFPNKDMARKVNHGMLYRRDIFKKNGIKYPPDGPDEWYEAMKTLKAKYPNSTPYVNKYNLDRFLEYMYTSWGNSKVHKANFMGYDWDDDRHKFAPAYNEWKDMLAYFRKYMEEGLLDPEFMTSSKDDWEAKMTREAQAFATYDWIGRMSIFQNTLKDILPEYDLAYGYPIGPKGSAKYIDQIKTYGLGVAGNSKNAEIAMQLIDWTYTDQGSMLTTMGVEGKTFEKDESTGKVTYPEIEAMGKKTDKSILTDEYGLFSFGVRFHPECVYFDLGANARECYKLMEGRVLKSHPRPVSTKEEKDREQELTPAIKKVVEEYAAAVIYGDKNLESDWDAYISELDKLGYKELEQLDAAAYERYKNN